MFVLGGVTVVYAHQLRSNAGHTQNGRSPHLLQNVAGPGVTKGERTPGVGRVYDGRGEGCRCSREPGACSVGGGGGAGAGAAGARARGRASARQAGGQRRAFSALLAGRGLVQRASAWGSAALASLVRFPSLHSLSSSGEAVVVVVGLTSRSRRCTLAHTRSDAVIAQRCSSFSRQPIGDVRARTLLRRALFRARLGVRLRGDGDRARIGMWGGECALACGGLVVVAMLVMLMVLLCVARVLGW